MGPPSGISATGHPLLISLRQTNETLRVERDRVKEQIVVAREYLNIVLKNEGVACLRTSVCARRRARGQRRDHVQSCRNTIYLRGRPSRIVTTICSISSIV